MKDVAKTISPVDELRDRGVTVYIDDFRTGYSSLSYLKRLPIQKLKIVKSFIHDITNDPVDREIIKANLRMAHSMDLKVVAEGVEDRNQFSFLKTQM